MENQSFFVKNKKLLIISSVVIVVLIVVAVAVFLLSRGENKNSTSQNNSDNYADFLPANTCPDSTMGSNGSMVAVLNGKEYLVTQENIAYMDANCKTAAADNINPVDNNRSPNYLALPTCEDGKTYFDTFPVNVNDLTAITPLGNINPPDHTVPTDHIYFVTKRTSEGFEGVPTSTKIMSPGNIVITGIGRTSEIKNGSILSDDFNMEYAGCRGVMYYFGHIKEITNPKLKVLFDGLTDCQSGSPAANTEIKNCFDSVDITLSNGEEIGTVKGGDLGAYNFTKRQSFLNTTLYPPKAAYGLCPLDQFSEPAKSQAYSKLNRTQEPKCGVIAQDKAGTLQGEWFYGDSAKVETFLNWDNHLSFVHDNVDPSIGTIAGSLSGPKMLMFQPQSSGNVNREVSQITPGNTIYCFQSEQDKAAHKYVTGSLLVQLKSETKVAIQWQDGDCNSNMNMTSPKEYVR